MKILSFITALDLSKGMKIALGVSLFIHVAVVLVGMIGLPYIKKPVVLPPQPISVDVVDISEITTINKKPNKAPPRPQKEPPPKVIKEVKAPPKVEAKEPPKVKPVEKPPEPPKEETKAPEPKTPPPPEKKLAEAKPEPKPKPEPPKKQKPKEEKKEEKTVTEEDFLSVLKNLQDDEPTGEVNPEGDKQTTPEESPLAKFADKLSATEADMIARRLNIQFASCWNLMAGARNAEDITVSINLQVRPDRTVQSAKIVDQWRYSQDSFYRAAADTALRAIKHPNCETLDLPEDKYTLWKDLTFNFNPAVQL